MKRIFAVLLSCMLLCAAVDAAFAEEETNVKSETVYALLDANGQLQKVLSSCHLENKGREDTLRDVSALTELSVLKGDANASVSNGAVLWQTNGEDVYYQGASSAPLPVTLTLHYTLDGQEISAEEAQGATGRLTLRVDYENTLRVTGDDGQETIVPLLALTGLVLDNNQARRIEAVNARVIDDGSHTVLVGAALPGLQACLDRDEIHLPDYLEVSADVTNFDVPMTLTLVTSEPFSALDASGLDRADELKTSMTDLTDAMAQLLDGSQQLYDGLVTLADKTDDLVEGVGQLAEGTQTLSDGLDTLCENNETLTEGAEQIFEALLQTAGDQLAAAGVELPKLTVENYAEQMESLLDGSYVEAATKAQVEQAVYAKEADVRAAVTEAVQQQVAAQVLEAVTAEVQTQVLAAMQLTSEAWQAGIQADTITEEQQAQVNAAVAQQLESETVQATLTSQTALQMETPEVAAVIDEQTAAQMETLLAENLASEEVVAQKEAAQAQLTAAVEMVQTQLESVRQFVAGLTAYTEGVAAVQAGARELNAGMLLLKDGAPATDDTPEQAGIEALPEGVTALRDGAQTLHDGLTALDDEGMQKLADAVNNDLMPLVETVRGLLEASDEYTSFSGVDDGMQGCVRFIYRTDTVAQ